MRHRSHHLSSSSRTFRRDSSLAPPPLFHHIAPSTRIHTLNRVLSSTLTASTSFPLVRTPHHLLRQILVTFQTIHSFSHLRFLYLFNSSLLLIFIYNILVDYYLFNYARLNLYLLFALLSLEMFSLSSCIIYLASIKRFVLIILFLYELLSFSEALFVIEIFSYALYSTEVYFLW